MYIIFITFAAVLNLFDPHFQLICLPSGFLHINQF